MEGLKWLKQMAEEQYLKDIDKAVETRIRSLDVIDTMREWSNETRRTEKAKSKLKGM